MMYWGNGDWNWTAWVAMSVSMVAFWGLVAFVVIRVARQSENARHSPENVLADRFARGEIDEDEYRRRRDALRADH